MSKRQHRGQLVKVIRILERACLSKNSSPTTAAHLEEMGHDEAERYFHWLCRQAPHTATFIVGRIGGTDFEDLWRAP